MRFVFPPTILTSVDEYNKIEENFVLEQNYPNPFNPTTNISFTLPASGDIKIKVYDSIGRIVSSVSFTNVSAGLNSYPFDAVNLPTGVYFYQLQFGEYIQTKKMMLVK